MYQKGEYILLKSGGIWEVMQSHTQQFHLRNLKTNWKKTLPANSTEIVRKICDKNSITEAIERVGFIRTIQAPNEKLRKELYDMAMNKFDEIEWIRIIKSVYLRKQDCRLSPWEENYGATAKEFFHGEISILLNIPYENVEQYITQAVSSDSW